MAKQTILFLLVLSLFASCRSDCDPCRKTQLYNMARSGNIDSLEFCITLGFDINKQDIFGNTLLMIASSHGVSETVDYLLENMADTRITNHNGFNAVNIAFRNSHFTIERSIKNHDYELWKSKTNNLNGAEFEYAIKGDNESIVKDFIKVGYDFKSTNESGISPIVSAIFSGSENIVALFLDNGADPNELFDSRPLIAIASMFGEIEIVEHLLQYGAMVNQSDGSGQSPLIFAAENGFLEIVKVLIESDADVSIKDRKNETAFDKAEINNHDEIAILLKEKQRLL